MDRINLKDKKEKEDRIKTDVPMRDGSVGIRATLNSMGFSDSSIGFDDKSGTVTLNGKNFMKPKYYDDVNGITYAPENDIRRELVSFYQNSSNPIVRVSDAFAAEAGKYGLTADALTYGNGVVSIGGAPLNTLYIDDTGKAWAWQNDVSNAVGNYAEGLGVLSPNELYKQYADEYINDIKNGFAALSEREPFLYDPSSDPVYLAYRQSYLTEGDRAGRNAMADYSALTGGYVNSAAATAGALANAYYAQQLSGMIPELAQSAYERYNDSYQNEINRLNSMIDVYDTAYGYAADANRQTVNGSNLSAESNRERDNAAYARQAEEYKRYWEDMFNKQEYDRNAQEYEMADQDRYWTDIFNNQLAIENSLKRDGYVLDNKQQEIYLEYYRRLIEAELKGKNLDNRKTEAELYTKYGR